MAPASRRQQQPASHAPNTTTSGHTPAPSSPATPQPPAPAQLAHFVIFNPTLAAAQSKAQPQQPPPDAAAATRAEAGGVEGDKGDTGHNGLPQETPDTVSSGEPAPAPPTAAATVVDPPPPPPPAQVDPGTRDRDLEDDLREAAQIVFYISREAGGVSRDTMLRQVGLAKGLMGFADMASAASSSSDPFWAVHTQNTRLIIYTPEPDWYVYVCVTLALVPAHSKAGRPSAGGDKEHVETVPAQGISDRMLVDALQRGYDDFVLQHGKFGVHTSQTALAGLEKYWTRFAFGFESEFLSPTYPDFLAWLGGHDPPPPQLDTGALDTFAADLLPAASGVGFVEQGGPQTSAGAVPDADSREAAALTRLLVSTLAALRPAVERNPPSVRNTAASTSTSDRQTLGFGFGRRRLHIAAVTPAPTLAASVKDKDKDDRKSSWGPLAWVGLGSTPTSRAVTPSPGAVPPSTTATAAAPASTSAPLSIPGRTSPTESVASVDVKDKAQQLKNGSVSTTASTSTKSRWPSFGLGGLETVGHALGLSAAPSPKPDNQEEKGEVAAEESKVEEAGEAPTPAEDEEEGNGEAEAGAKEGSPKASFESATAENAPTSDAPALETGDATTPDPAAVAEPVDTAATPISPVNPDELAAATTEPLDPTPTPAKEKDTDSVSVADTVVSVSQTPVLLPDLVAANDDRVDVTWGSKGVWLAGVRRRLSYVVRDSLLLYIIYRDADPRDPPSGASTVALFDAVVPALASASAAAGSAARAHPPPERVPPDTTIYHLHDVTEKRALPTAPLDPAVAELRDIIATGAVTDVYAQTPSARFAVAKRGKETGAELFVLTGRKDASLTDAERAVRGYSYVREV